MPPLYLKVFVEGPCKPYSKFKLLGLEGTHDPRGAEVPEEVFWDAP